jgi:hypothetical protein
MELDIVIKMDQDKLKPRIALGAAFKAEIPLWKHWLSTLPVALQSGIQMGPEWLGCVVQVYVVRD